MFQYSPHCPPLVKWHCNKKNQILLFDNVAYFSYNIGRKVLLHECHKILTIKYIILYNINEDKTNWMSKTAATTPIELMQKLTTHLKLHWDEHSFAELQVALPSGNTRG
jgi:hypothetical protein